MSRHYRLKPAGYVVIGILLLLLGLGIFFIVRAISNAGSNNADANATPTPVLAGSDAALSATATATLPPLSAATPTSSPTMIPSTPTPTAAAATSTPKPAATATPSSSIRKPTSSEKKSAQAGYLSGEGINLRVGPSTDYMSLGKYVKGDTLIVYATDGDFYFVKMDSDDAIGFMSKKFITVGTVTKIPENVPTDAIPGVVSASKIALRTGPSKTDTAVAEAPRGEALYIYYQTGDFYYVEIAANGKKGFAYASYVTANGTVPIPE